jgi:RNA polymerase sigma-70 factor (ECF subfamily)
MERDLEWIRACVRRRLGPMLKQKAEAEDYVQEAVVEILQYGPRFVISDREHFLALLARIVENVLRDKHEHFTAKRRTVQREEPLGSGSAINLDPGARSITRPSEAASANEMRSLILLGLELLGSEDRRAVLLREWEGLTFAEMGERLGVSEEGARIRFQRALPKLLAKIEKLRRGRLRELLAPERLEPPPA